MWLFASHAFDRRRQLWWTRDDLDGYDLELVTYAPGVHRKQIAHDHWWMGIGAAGKYFHLHFGLRDGRLFVELSDQSEGQTECTFGEGDNRDQPVPDWTR